MREDKQLFLNKVCEALQNTSAAAPGLGHNGLLEIKYIKKPNGDEFARPVFEDSPDRDDGYYDVNISGDSCIGIWFDLTNKFIRRMW